MKMTKEIDSGDILEQSTFPISDHETTLSLSVKCYEEAINTFKVLIKKVVNGTVNRIMQDKSLRSYYSYLDKPNDVGWIQWNNSAEYIQKICRALNLGNYSDNTFLSAKFIIGNQLFIVNSTPQIGESSTVSPGTIIKYSKKNLEVSTKTNNLLFSGIHCINLRHYQSIETKPKLYIPQKI